MSTPCANTPATIADTNDTFAFQGKESIMKTRWLLFVLIGLLAVLSGPRAAAQEPASIIVFENDTFRWEVGGDGTNLRFIDKATGTDHCKHEPASFVAQVKKGGAVHNASAASYHHGRLSLEFGAADIRTELAVTLAKRHLLLEVAAVEGDGVEELSFVDVPLALAGNLDDPFTCCALALNLQTNVREIPGPSSRLRAMCYPKFGLVGAKVALLGSPAAQLRDVMKEVVSKAKDIPQSDIGGPWALDAEAGRGSYLFDFGQCTEKTVDDWVKLVKDLGLNQVDFHTGHSLRFGDCRPNPDLFPNGRDSVKAVIDKLHAAGISAGLHTYAFFIAKNTPYVTPVPDPRLGKGATFTLAGALSTEADAVPVTETTQNMSTTTGFFVRNSVTLQIDDELITYAGIAKEPPYAFTGCTRGAYGTTAAAHAQDAKVHHLKECFGLFTPDADSTLLAEVATNTADTFNACGFDMIYLDALDGEDILGGGANSWHYGSKFVFEIANRLNRPALFEMSTFHHHLWYVRARMGAWDHPTRSHKRFIDIHAVGNQAGAKMYLPMNLGWWGVKTWNGARTEPTFPDDIEYLLGKCLGNGMGLSLMGVNPDNIGTVPAYQRLAPIFKQYEDLRHAGYFPETVKAELRKPGAEFTMEQSAEGNWQFRRAGYAKHKVCGLDGWSDTWTTTNSFEPQPLKLRIEALMTAGPYDAPDNIVIEAFGDPVGNYTDRAFQSGVEGTLVSSTEQVKVGDASGRFAATSSHDNPKAAWGKIGKVYEPVLDMSKHQAMGVWVHGDGQGELLNLQLKSPPHISHGTGDHYIVVDFTGWRYFELLEHEGERIEEYSWPYGGAYAIYREDVSFPNIDHFSLWCNNLPKAKEVTCYLSPVKALPVVSCTVRNPRITVAGKTITFPTDLESGQYIEFLSMTDCKLYGPQGELVKELTPEGDVPELAGGDSALAFSCDAPDDGLNPRARVTVITHGEVVR
jgi:hypothetical protein